MAKLTKANRARLEKLAAYLEGLPADYEHFDMGTWFEGAATNAAEINYARHNGGIASCGTAACAAGHGPAAGVLVPPRFIDGRGWVDWGSYCSLFVGENGSVLFQTPQHKWCFAASWSRSDDHHWGAAARIRYLLAHGEPPREFYSAGCCWLTFYAPYRIDAPVSA